MASQSRESMQYYPASPETGVVHNYWRNRFIGLGEQIEAEVMSSRARSMALTKLDEALMWLNKAVAQEGAINVEEIE